LLVERNKTFDTDNKITLFQSVTMASRIFSSGFNNLVRQSVNGRAQQRYFNQTSRPLQNTSQATNPEDNLPPEL